MTDSLVGGQEKRKMPQIDFYFVDCEMEHLLDLTLRLGLEWIPDLKYDRPEPCVYHSRQDILDCAKPEPHWFLRRDDFSRLPFDFHQIKGGSADGKYFIMQRNGGPTLDLFWSGIREKDGVRFIRSGDLGHYGTFWNTATEEFEKAPVVQRTLYRRLAAFIKAESVETENPPGWRPERIGKEAARQWTQGLQLGWQQTRRPKTATV